MFKKDKIKSSDPQFGIVITHKSSVSGKNDKTYSANNGYEKLVPYNFPARAMKRLKSSKGLLG